MRRSKLYEGMWAGDLADLVQPLISIDEYSSKINDEAVVVGFYVSERDAADDLNRFIQRSPISMVDSDVSPAPDQRGFYIVFVEIIFNERAVANITSLLEEVSPLVSVDSWQMRVRNVQGLVNYDADRLAQILKANQIADKINSLKKQIETLKQKPTHSPDEEV